MKKYKKASKNRSIVVWLALFFSFNIIGVSYAYWNDGIHVDVSIVSGYINPIFDTGANNLIESDCIMLHMKDDSIQIKTSINQDIQRQFEFQLVNEGTVPYRTEEIRVFGDEKISDLVISQDSIILNIDTTEDNDAIKIEERNYYFMYQVVLAIPTGKWKKKLEIEGEINIIPMEVHITDDTELSVEKVIKQNEE